jgi:hypothetical protein
MKTMCILLLFILAGCHSVSGSSQGSVASAISARRTLWDRCVNASFASQKATISDRNMAAEVAFMSCQAEEGAIIALLSTNSYVHVGQVILAMRAAKKQALVSAT